MNLLSTSRLGQTGEDVACDFLLSRGHHILDRNWRAGHLELDIVSEAPDGLHFVEVKARTAPVTSTLTDQAIILHAQPPILPNPLSFLTAFVQ